MPENLTLREHREATHYSGEMASSRLHDIILERFAELQELGLTQADVAARLGLSQQQVARWMGEPRNMTIKSAGRLLSALEAHLLFDLDRFELIRAGNCPAKEVVQATITNAPQKVVVAPRPQVQIVPTLTRTLQSA